MLARIVTNWWAASASPSPVEIGLRPGELKVRIVFRKRL